MTMFRQAIALCSVATLSTSMVLGVTSVARADVEEEREEAVEELNRSQEVFQEIATDPESQIPPSIMRDSEAVMILTNVGQGGFIFGGRRGDGLITLREPDGGWSQPAFVTLGGGSFGLQFGGRSSDLVMLVMNQEAIDDILDGDVELGANVTGTAGPVGATVADPAAANGDILIYSRSTGLFGEVSAGGTSIEFDEERNEAFYGAENVTPMQILTNPTSDLRPAASSAQLEQTLLSIE